MMDNYFIYALYIGVNGLSPQKANQVLENVKALTAKSEEESAKSGIIEKHMIIGTNEETRVELLYPFPQSDSIDANDRSLYIRKLNECISKINDILEHNNPS